MKKDLILKVGSEFFTDSELVARKFQIKHAKVVRTIERLLSRHSKMRGTSEHPHFKVMRMEKEYHGNKYNSYRIDKMFFILLAMRFENKKALEWQVKFIERFEENEKLRTIAETNKTNDLWFAAREKKKLDRKTVTDAIKLFVQYATDSGSKGASHYFKAFTKLSYDAIGIEYTTPCTRDALTPEKLVELATVEGRIAALLLECMSIEMPYKKSYQHVKKMILEGFAS